MNIRTALMTLLLALTASFHAVQAQANCPALVERALSAVGNNCSELDRNNACYGYNRVNATFLSEVSDNFFTTPSDRTALADLRTIQTATLDVDNDVWGVAVLSLQANIPNTIPGQAVQFLLMGDVEMENAVTPEEAFAPADPITVTISAGSANIRSGPGLNRNVVGGVPRGTELQADGLSADGGWLRVIYNGAVAWVARIVLAEDAAIDGLPNVQASNRMPMQAFYLRTGIGEPACEEAPRDVLVVQGPQNFEVELTLNGVDMRVGSTVMIYQTVNEETGETQMIIVVTDGRVVIPGGGPDGEDIIIEEGFSSAVCLGEPEDRGTDGEANDREPSCPFSPPERIDYRAFGEAFCTLENVPETVLNYNIELVCGDDPIPTPPPPRPQNTGGGQQPRGTTSSDPSVDCSNFRLISPLGATAATDITYSWSGAPGADQYKVNFYNYEGGYVTSFFVNPPQTSVIVNAGNIAVGGALQWEVEVIKNGQSVCNTGRTNFLTRERDPNEPPGGYGSGPSGPGLSASWACTSFGELTVTWSGAESGDTITVFYNNFYGPTNVSVGAGPSGGGVIYDFYPPYNNARAIASPSGRQGNLANIATC